jgi:hypothetical protein
MTEQDLFVQGKYWPDLQQARHIEIGGVCWLLDHLKDSVQTITAPASSGNPAVVMTLRVQYSSHCVSYGPKLGRPLDFNELGYEVLVIDHRQNRRAFHAGRHELSFHLPSIIASLAERRCFFTAHENFLTLELGKLIPEASSGARYEIYFSVRQAELKNTLKVFIESAYLRDENGDHAPLNFKKADKITGWKLMLNKVRGTSIKAARNSPMKIGMKKK